MEVNRKDRMQAEESTYLHGQLSIFKERFLTFRVWFSFTKAIFLRGEFRAGSDATWFVRILYKW